MNESNVGLEYQDRMEELEAENLAFEARVLELQETLTFQVNEVKALKEALQTIATACSGTIRKFVIKVLAESKEEADAKAKEGIDSDMLPAGENDEL